MGTLWSSYLNGLAVTAGLIVAIGAQNAFVLAQSLRREHHLPVAALCIFCDAVLVSLGVFGLAALLAESPTLLSVTRWGGVAFLLWYGLQALLRALRPQALQQGDEPRPRSLRAVLLIGSLGAQQPEPGAYTAGAASASLAWFTMLALGGAWLAPWLARPLTWRLIDLGVAGMMFAVAAQLAFAG